MDEENERLLDDNQNQRASHRLKHQSWYTTVSEHPFLYSYFLLLHILLLIVVFGYVSNLDYDPRIIFPELRSLRRIIKTGHATNHTLYSVYSGPPNEANAAAWTHLLQPLYFNASKEELLADDASLEISVQVKDGGYIAALGVYHEIHCLNKLRYFLYSYNVTQSQRAMWEDHLDHCLEVLRISVMCTADLSLYTFSWPENPDAMFLDAHSKSPRKCADWTQLEEYAWGRKTGLAPTLIKTLQDGVKVSGER